MNMYGVSDKHTGPWLGESEKPDQALAKGRAMWGDGRDLYVAEIDILDPTRHMPSVEGIIGELRERLVDKFGSGADAVFDDKKVMTTLSVWWEHEALPTMLMRIEEQADIDFTVAGRIKMYKPTFHCKVSDFK